MRFDRIVLLDFQEKDFAPEDWRALRGMARDVDPVRRDDPELPARLADADCLLVQLGVAVGPDLLAAAPRLRYVGVFGTSTAGVDASDRPGVAVRNVPGYGTEAVAEFAVGAVLDHLRGLFDARRRAAAGDLSEPPLGRELRGRRFGVVGLGAIGRRVAEIAGRGFGACVSYWSRTPRPDAAFPHVELDRLLGESEIVSVHVASTPETKGLVDPERIAGGALLVHLVPTNVLNVESLVRRASDVHFVTDHADELPPDVAAALARSGRCTCYPPVGYRTVEADAARRERFLGDLARFLSG